MAVRPATVCFLITTAKPMTSSRFAYHKDVPKRMSSGHPMSDSMNSCLELEPFKP